MNYHFAFSKRNIKFKFIIKRILDKHEIYFDSKANYQKVKLDFSNSIKDKCI